MAMTEEDPRERLRSLLKDIPHSLLLDELLGVKEKKCRAILERLTSERGRPWELEEELIRGNNFMSLLHLRLGHKEEALGLNSLVLQKCPSNITALVNKAYMKLTSGHEEVAKNTVEELQNMANREDYNLLLATADAEQAYSFSRIGPPFYSRSVDLFMKVISQFPSEYLWQFGCALTCRRCLNMPKSVKELTVERLKILCTKAVSYLSDTVINTKCQHLRARAWVELGELYSSLKNPIYPLTSQIVEVIKVDGIQMTPEQCFDSALQIPEAKEDEFVLQRCGKQLRFARPSCRYERTLQECYTLLLMAYKIRPTSYSCDNLATVLFKMAENKVEPNEVDIDLRRAYGTRGRGHQGGYRPHRRSNRRGFNRGRQYSCDYGRYAENDGGKFSFVDGRANWRGNVNRGRYVGFDRGRCSRRPRGQGSQRAKQRLDFSKQVPVSSTLNPGANEFVPQCKDGATVGLVDAATDHTSEEDCRHERQLQVNSTFNEPSDIDGITEKVDNLSLSSKRGIAKRKQKFKKCLTSPKKVDIYPSHPLLEKAVMYLKESLGLSEECNMSAMYTLGLMYRRLGETELAVQQFRQIFSEKDSSLYHKINAYEQTGFCLQEMSKDCTLSEDKREGYRKESKLMMQRTVELAAKLLAETPTMIPGDLDSWQAFPTLKQLLADEPGHENVKEIAHLCELIGNHKESLECYEKLRVVDPEDHTITCKIIETYMRLKDFSNAISFLKILLCTAEGKKLTEQKPNLIYQVFLGAVRHLIHRENSSEDMEMIQDCCRSAFGHKYGGISTEEDENWDVFILDEPDQTGDEATAIQSWLKETCGLSVTRNDEEALGQDLSFSAEVDFITRSSCLVVVLGSNFTKRLRNLITIALNTEKPGLIIPVVTCSHDLPRLLIGHRQVTFTHSHTESPLIPFDCFTSLLEIDYRTFKWLE